LGAATRLEGRRLLVSRHELRAAVAHSAITSAEAYVRDSDVIVP
jgi:hypothetical protein